MQDRYFIEEDGTRTAVSDLPMHIILELLCEGVEVIRDVTEDQFMDRLRIELIARSIAV